MPDEHPLKYKRFSPWSCSKREYFNKYVNEYESD